ncbi:MAG: hypothetical protein DRO36_00950 [Candidatus Hecatellales archaeon]|nr:MAG: hypothetical protein DRO36_00950 [Candidatus Hecatellales archaeon]
MKPFSFVHIADIHLGYMQYNLAERREDFAKAFIEAVDKTIKLKPSFVLLAGDIFDSPRPSNQTLATAIRELRRLRDSGIRVFAVDGSHDLEPNIMTGTILIPLHNAGLISYLPRLEGGCWRDENCYIYGVQSSRSLREADEKIPEYMRRNPPKPNPNLFNIFVFHGALDNPKYVPPYLKPDLRMEYLPEGFNYYAGGHVHEPSIQKFKTGVLAYPGCLETTTYTEAEIQKGFYYVEVESPDSPPKIERIKIENTRRFVVEERDFSGLTPEKITLEASNQILKMDVEDAILVLLLKGELPPGFKKSQIDMPRIKASAKKALYTVVLNQMVESEQQKLPPKIRETRELKTVAYEYLLKMFREQKYPEEFCLRMAKTAIDILDPLLGGDEEKVKSMLEEAAKKR